MSIPQTLPPTARELSFPSLSWSESNGVWVGAPSLTTAMAWSFADAGTGVVRYHVCVGVVDTTSGCIIEEKNVTGREQTTIPFDNSLALGGTSATYFVTVTAFDHAGFSTERSARVMMDWTPPSIGNLTVNGYLHDGKPRPVKLSDLKLRVIGGVADDDVDFEDLSMHWELTTLDAMPVPTCDFHMTEDANAWTAVCDPGHYITHPITYPLIRPEHVYLLSDIICI